MLSPSGPLYRPEKVKKLLLALPRSGKAQFFFPENSQCKGRKGSQKPIVVGSLEESEWRLQKLIPAKDTVGWVGGGVDQWSRSKIRAHNRDQFVTPPDSYPISRGDQKDQVAEWYNFYKHGYSEGTARFLLLHPMLS